MRRHKIEIMQSNDDRDEQGFPVENWEPICSPVWADVRDVSGKEFYGADTEKRQKLITCNISYRKDITNDMQVRFDGEMYNIKRIYQGDYRRLDLNLDCQLVEGVGR